MQCKCCISLRGLAYLGASTHVVIGFLHFTDFLDGLFAINVKQITFESDNLNLGTDRLVYHWVFLSLGILIFQGIDRESKTLVKRTAVIFFVLQVLTIGVRLKNGQIYSTLSRGLAMCILSTGLYLLILYLYVRKLEGRLFYADHLFPSNTPSNPSHIPLSTPNLGWYNHSHSSRIRANNNNNGTLYSPLGFFGGGFNPMVWNNPGPPPPYTDAAPSNEIPLHRNQSSVRSQNTQPCSSRTVTTSGTTCQDNNTDTKILTVSRNSQPEGNEPGDASVVPLLDENADKNGLES